METAAKLFIKIGVTFIHVACGVWGIICAGVSGWLFFSSSIPITIINLIYECIPSISLIPAQGIVMGIIKGLLVLLFAGVLFLILLALGFVFVGAGEKIQKKDFSFVGGWICSFVIIGFSSYALITYPVSLTCSTPSPPPSFYEDTFSDDEILEE